VLKRAAALNVSSDLVAEATQAKPCKDVMGHAFGLNYLSTPPSRLHLHNSSGAPDICFPTLWVLLFADEKSIASFFVI
jgi:hypothetical protein